MYDEAIMPKSLDSLIVDLCSDYFRRKRLIERRDAPYTVIMECRFLNYRMLDAAKQIVGESDAEIFIREIGEGVGYAHSRLMTYSERIYKERKLEVKRSIAKRLSLF